MKLKLILCLLGVFSLMEVNAHSVVNKNEVLQMSSVQLTGNDVPFDILTKGDTDDHRSAQPQVPIYVMLDSNSRSLEVYFEKAIGEVYITIFQDGTVVYSSSEDIQVAMQMTVQLNLEASGNFLIGIEGKNGAYVCGQFEL